MGRLAILGFFLVFLPVNLLTPVKPYLWAAKEKCRTGVKQKDGSFRAVPVGSFPCNGETSDRFP